MQTFSTVLTITAPHLAAAHATLGEMSASLDEAINAHDLPKGCAVQTGPLFATTNVSMTHTKQQTNDYTELLSVGELRLRVAIHCDSTEFQSRAHIDVFSTAKMEWSQLALLDYTQMASKTGYKHTAPTEADYAADRNKLIKMAAAVFNFPTDKV